MSDTPENGAAAPDAQAAAQQVSSRVLAQYIRDMSFENAVAQKGVQGEVQPARPAADHREAAAVRTEPEARDHALRHGAHPAVPEFVRVEQVKPADAVLVGHKCPAFAIIAEDEICHVPGDAGGQELRQRAGLQRLPGQLRGPSAGIRDEIEALAAAVEGNRPVGRRTAERL